MFASLKRLSFSWPTISWPTFAWPTWFSPATSALVPLVAPIIGVVEYVIYVFHINSSCPAAPLLYFLDLEEVGEEDMLPANQITTCQGISSMQNSCYWGDILEDIVQFHLWMMFLEADEQGWLAMT